MKKRHFPHTLFGKLFLAYAVTFVFVVGGFIMFRKHSETSVNENISVENLTYYAEILTDLIGTPPDREALDLVLLNSELNIRIDGPEGIVYLNEEEERREDEEWPDPEKGFLSLLFFRKEGDSDVTVIRGEYIYSYSDFHGDYRFYPFGFGILFVFFLFGISLNYLMVRRLLHPLKRMSRVTGQFGRNDWNARVCPKGKDDLAVLGRDIDAMADRIVGYIDAMRELLYSVSHEFRSPLTRMKILLEFLEDSDARASLGEEIEFLDRITGSLLEQKKLESQLNNLVLSEFSLGDVLMEFTESYRRKGLPLEWSMTGSDRKVVLDKSRLLLAISNLVENSFKYAPGGKVILDVIVPGDRPYCQVRVSDEGPGISDENRRFPDMPFFKHDSEKGYGMGLNIVRTIAEAHGGSLSMENLYPRGLRVTLEFPLVPPS